MPGYEKSQFVSLSQTEKVELSCGICFGIFIDPMVTPCCRQTYCNECINEWLNQNNTCPNDMRSLKSEGLLQPPRLVINLLNKLNMRCSFLENGCNQIVLLEKLRQHMDCCKHNPEAICRECGTKNGDRGLHNCVENLLSKITSIEKLNRETIQRYELLENELKQNREKHFEVNKEINNLKKQNIRMNEENDKLKQSNNCLKADNSRVKNNRAICEATIDKLRKVNTDLVNKYREINEKLEKMIEYNKTFENMMRIKNELIEEINKLEANKESLNRENKELKELSNKIESSDKEIVYLKTTISKLKENSKISNERVEELKNSVSKNYDSDEVFENHKRKILSSALINALNPTFIEEHISKKLKQNILKISREAVKFYSSFRDIAYYINRSMNEAEGGKWHAIVQSIQCGDSYVFFDNYHYITFAFGNLKITVFRAGKKLQQRI